MVALPRFTRPLMIAAASALAVGATAQDAPLPGSEIKGNWGAKVTETDGGHLIGKPQAEGKLVEYMSYTCSHCATFARSGDGAIKMLYVPTGKVSYEIRHLIRDPVDIQWEQVRTETVWYAVFKTRRRAVFMSSPSS